MRFTITRAVKGFWSLAIQLASASRRPVVFASATGLGASISAPGGFKTVTAPGAIGEPLLSTLPRCKKYEAGASGPGSVTACTAGKGAGLLLSNSAMEL